MTLRIYGHVYDDALASAGDVLLGGCPAPTATIDSGERLSKRCL